MAATSDALLAIAMATTGADGAALYLAEIEGYRFQEIGPMLGCSEVSARKSASRARAADSGSARSLSAAA